MSCRPHHATRIPCSLSNTVTLRFVVAHARPGLVINVKELVRYDRGNAGYRHLDEILVQHLDPELPARRELLKVACACGNKLLVGMVRFEAQLEALHDPGVPFSIVK